jgi:hypothetical protein
VDRDVEDAGQLAENLAQCVVGVSDERRLFLVGVDVIREQDVEMAADTAHRRSADVPGLLGLQIDVKHRDARDLAEILTSRPVIVFASVSVVSCGRSGWFRVKRTNGIGFLFPHGGQPANWSG